MKRRRFNPNAVASSDGFHTRVSHDQKATGRRTKRDFVKCGFIKIPITAMQAAMLAPYQHLQFL